MPQLNKKDTLRLKGAIIEDTINFFLHAEIAECGFYFFAEIN